MVKIKTIITVFGLFILRGVWMYSGGGSADIFISADLHEIKALVTRKPWDTA